MMETAHLQTLTVTALMSGKGTDATLVMTTCPHADTVYIYMHMYMQLYVMSLVSVRMEAAACTLTSTVRVG